MAHQGWINYLEKSGVGIQNGYSERMTRMDEIKYLEMFLETKGTRKREDV